MTEITPVWPEGDAPLLSSEDAEAVHTTFAKSNIGAGLWFKIEAARIDGRRVTDYESYVTSRHRLDGDLIIGLASGHTFNLSDYLRRLQTGDF